MNLQEQSAEICPGCGTRRERTSVGDIGCMLCLLRVGLNDVAEQISAEAGPAPSANQFGTYTIARRDDGTLWELGRGAMGITFRALDASLNRAVALKIIHTDAAQGATARERFVREARAAAALRHPNIATVYQFGICEQTGQCFYAMELVEGETLDTRVRRTGPMDALSVIDVAQQIADALAAAETRGVVHRDLKPANIMIVAGEDDDDPARSLQKPGKHRPGKRRRRDPPSRPTVKVIDFGVAKALTEKTDAMTLTHNGFIGTPAFASPEQFVNAPVDVRSDTYSLGATIWYLLTGRSVFPGQTVEEIREKQRSAMVPLQQLKAARVPSRLISLLNSMLALEPAARPNTHDLALKLRRCRTQVTHRGSPAWSFTLAGALIVAVLLFAVRSPRQGSTSSASSGSEKSVAVLPFQNLSDDNANAYFASGIQDEILTRLSKIAGLKVISRTSTQHYSARPDNLSEIAHQLAVANILEGSVQKTADQVHINVQLIRAATDEHLWAESYDRKLENIFGVEGEVATAVTEALKAKLAPEEKARLEAKPTDNPDAYALYLKALGRERAVNLSLEDLTAAEQLYGQAIALDPKFALAHARLSIVNSYLVSEPSDNSRTLGAKARVAAEEALRLSPSLGEAHMALGLCLYYAETDYAAALKEFSIAAATLPNEPDIFRFIGGIYRRQGRWRESLVTYQRAQDRDPRNRYAILGIADTHLFVRDWAGATEHYERQLEIEPDSAAARASLAYIEVFRNGNPTAGRKLLQNIPAGVDPLGIVTESRWDLAMLERDYASAEKILNDSPLAGFPRTGEGAKAFFRGRTALARGDVESAQRYFAAAAPSFEGRVRDDPDDALLHARLGLLYAYMHRADDAIREGRRAVELEPESQNALLDARASANLALVYALLGKPDQAIPLIERLLSIPGPLDWPDFPQSITLADLRLRWEWDSLRSNPRFQKILAGPEPKTVY